MRSIMLICFYQTQIYRWQILANLRKHLTREMCKLARSLCFRKIHRDRGDLGDKFKQNKIPLYPLNPCEFAFYCL